MAKRAISMSRLATTAQFGNQVCMNAHIRTYAKDHGCDYLLPRWVGCYLWGFTDNHETFNLSPYQERVEPAPPGRIGKPIPPVGDELVGHDFRGFAQYHTSWYAKYRDFIQGLYANPIDPQKTRVEAAYDKLKSRGKTLIGLHLRRGDSGRSIYPYLPIEWCLRWLHHNWSRFQHPVLFISTEDASLASWFAHYNPVVAEDLGIEFKAEPYPGYNYPFPIEARKARQLDYFPDWFLLQQCEVLLASDSSFSMTAAWTSTKLRECWRMKLSLRDFERTDPWNMHFCNREHLDDYPGIPGTSLDENPGFGWEGFRPKHKAVPEDPMTFTPYLRPKR